MRLIDTMAGIQYRQAAIAAVGPNSSLWMDANDIAVTFKYITVNVFQVCVMRENTSLRWRHQRQYYNSMCVLHHDSSTTMLLLTSSLQYCNCSRSKYKSFSPLPIISSKPPHPYCPNRQYSEHDFRCGPTHSSVIHVFI